MESNPSACKQASKLGADIAQERGVASVARRQVGQAPAVGVKAAQMNAITAERRTFADPQRCFHATVVIIIFTRNVI